MAQPHRVSSGEVTSLAPAVAIHSQAIVARKALAVGDKNYQAAAEAMQAMVDEGFSQRAVADQVGCSQSKVSLLLIALQLHVVNSQPFGEAFTEGRKARHGQVERELPEAASFETFINRVLKEFNDKFPVEVIEDEPLDEETTVRIRALILGLRTAIGE
jgi:hypothetical protein